MTDSTDARDRTVAPHGPNPQNQSQNVYTHGHAPSVLRSHRWRTIANSAAYLEPELTPHHRVLDLGTGPGTIGVELATRVEHVTLTEISDDALAHSRKHAAEVGVDNVTFAVENVHSLSFADNTFDIVHAHQVLQHVADPVHALREMARVTKPGGLVAARDADYAAFTWWPVAPQLDRWLELYSRAARANRGEPDAGRCLLAWAHAAGLAGTTATSSTWCYASADEVAWWSDLWADRITKTDLSEQLVRDGYSSRDELEHIAAGWRTWGADPDAWFNLLHGEILWRKPLA